MKGLIFLLIIFEISLVNTMEEKKRPIPITNKEIEKLSNLHAPICNIIIQQLVNPDFFKNIFELYIKESHQITPQNWPKNQLTKALISPDGNYLLQKSSTSTNDAVYLINIKTHNTIPLVYISSEKFNYFWINKHLFLQFTPTHSLVYHLNKDTVTIDHLDNDTLVSMESKSPNEKFIIHVIKNEIRILNLVDKNDILIIPTQSATISLDWSASSRYLAISYQPNSLEYVRFAGNSCNYYKIELDIWDIQEKKLLKNFKNIYKLFICELLSTHLKWAYYKNQIALITTSNSEVFLNTILLYSVENNKIENIIMPLEENLTQLFFIKKYFIYFSTDHSNLLYNYQNRLFVSVIPKYFQQFASQNGKKIIFINKQKKISYVELTPILEEFEKNTNTLSLSKSLVFLIIDIFIKYKTPLDFNTLCHPLIRRGLQEIKETPLLNNAFRKLYLTHNKLVKK